MRLVKVVDAGGRSGGSELSRKNGGALDDEIRQTCAAVRTSCDVQLLVNSSDGG